MSWLYFRFPLFSLVLDVLTLIKCVWVHISNSLHNRETHQLYAGTDSSKPPENPQFFIKKLHINKSDSKQHTHFPHSFSKHVTSWHVTSSCYFSCFSNSLCLFINCLVFITKYRLLCWVSTLYFYADVIKWNKQVKDNGLKQKSFKHKLLYFPVVFAFYGRTDSTTNSFIL